MEEYNDDEGGEACIPSPMEPLDDDKDGSSMRGFMIL
jgi:hypothetical protein